MKYSIALKFVAVMLAACTLVSAVFCGIGVLVLSQLGFYAYDWQHWQETVHQEVARGIAGLVLDRYAVTTYSDCPETLLEQMNLLTDDDRISALCQAAPDSWRYRITDLAGKTLFTNVLPEEYASAYLFDFDFLLTGWYPATEDRGETCAYQDTFVDNTGKTHILYYHTLSDCVVTVYLTADAVTSHNGIPMYLAETLFRLRFVIAIVLAASLLVFAICLVFLLSAAGKTGRNATPAPGGLNRMPLDVYLAVTLGGGFGLLHQAMQVLDSWETYYHKGSFNPGLLVLAAGILLVAAVLALGFFMAVSAQSKMKGGYWWHRSLIGFLLGKIWYVLYHLGKAVMTLISMLPLVWKWLLLAMGMGIAVVAATSRATYDAEGVLLLALVCLLCALVVAYVAYCLGVLMSGAKRMAEGNLSVKISTRFLRGSFARCAEHLNTLADVATQAAKQQLRSDRMKTELITNVSHDIKTPLTSIINYVDLLRRPHTPEEEAQYLDVLGRQSLRMKKLIEDLTEMSKATTGNLSIDIARMDAVEAVNQALGEFADKLAAVPLYPVFPTPTASVLMYADGRLVWRVLSNLLSNVVKYAMPGTRVYLDLVQAEDCVLISVKNISREPLNVSADELTERFVRGDQSRNTEGSGLGLNIAKSLMELQRGHLQLLVDGDLFKVTLVFPQGGLS